MRIVSIRYRTFVNIVIFLSLWSTSVVARPHIDPVDEITKEIYKKSEKPIIKTQKASALKKQKRASFKNVQAIALKKSPSLSNKDSLPLTAVASSKDSTAKTEETKETAPLKNLHVQTKDGDHKEKNDTENDTTKDKAPTEDPLQKTSVTTTKGAQQSLPLPRFVSIKATAAHLHVGPGDHYPIEWRYVRQFLPVEILLEFDHWRQIRDSQGTVGWVHKTLLSSRRFAMVQNKVANLYKNPNNESPIVATVEPGVITKLIECNNTMCHVDIKGIRGWIQRDLLFGVYPDESQFS